MPKAVEDLVTKLLADPDFYPDKSPEDRKSIAYGIANKQIEGSAHLDPIIIQSSVDGGEFSLIMGADGMPSMLLFKNQVLARAEVNSNRDEIDEQGIDELVASIVGYPIDIEHNRAKIAGVFTAAKKDEQKAARVDGAIWADLYPDDAQAVMAGQAGLSILAKAKVADCSMCGQSFTSASQYCEHLRDRQTSSAIRRLHGLAGRGGAITRRPAASNANFDPRNLFIVASHQEQKPEGVDIKESTMTEEEITKLKNELAAALAKVTEFEPFKAKAEALEAEKAAFQASLDAAKAAQDKAEKERDEATGKINEMVASARRTRIGKALTDEEWEAQKAHLLAMPNDAFELIASKMTAPVKGGAGDALFAGGGNGAVKVVL